MKYYWDEHEVYELGDMSHSLERQDTHTETWSERKKTAWRKWTFLATERRWSDNIKMYLMIIMSIGWDYVSELRKHCADVRSVFVHACWLKFPVVSQGHCYLFSWETANAVRTGIVWLLCVQSIQCSWNESKRNGSAACISSPLFKTTQKILNSSINCIMRTIIFVLFSNYYRLDDQIKGVIWQGHTARMGGMRNEYRKPKRKRSHRRPRRRR